MELHRMESCCGIGELEGLYDGAKRAVSIVADECHFIKYPLYVFTDAISNKHGVRLAKYIKKHKLGQVWNPKPVRNPNTRRLITIWIWKPDHKAIKKHALTLE